MNPYIESSLPSNGLVLCCTLEPIRGHECTFQKLDTQFHLEWQGHLHSGQGKWEIATLFVVQGGFGIIDLATQSRALFARLFIWDLTLSYEVWKNIMEWQSHTSSTEEQKI